MMPQVFAHGDEATRVKDCWEGELVSGTLMALLGIGLLIWLILTVV